MTHLIQWANLSYLGGFHQGVAWWSFNAHDAREYKTRSGARRAMKRCGKVGVTIVGVKCTA